MSDYYENNTDLSNEKTVAVDPKEIEKRLREMREAAINGTDTVKDDFAIPPDFFDMPLDESTAQEPEEQYVPFEDERVLSPEWEASDENLYTPAERKKHKRKVVILIVCAIVAAVLIGVLAAVLLAKDRHSDVEYISYYETAQSSFGRGEYDEALDALRQAMSINKTDECLLLMSDCYEAKGDYVNALAILESSETGSPEISTRIRELEKARTAFEESKKVRIDGEEFSVDTTTLDLSGRGLESRELTELRNLTELTSLRLSGNKIDSLEFLKPLRKLVSLDLSDNELEDISMLYYLSSLKTLHLDGNDIESFKPLYGLKNLTKLTISDIKISKSKLDELKKALPNCVITSDKAEADVVEISIGGKTFKSDVKEIDLSNCGVSDISALKDCKNLEILNLAGNSVKDVSQLMDLPKLRSVSLENNGISDIRPLMGLTTLEYLNLSGNNISSIAALGELTALEELSLKGNRINDFSPLSKLVLIEMLDLTDTGITDSSLQYLYRLKELERLALDRNEIGSRGYAALKEQLPNCNISCSEFKKVNLGKRSFEADALYVDASGLGIKDITAVEGFTCVERMDLSNNSISDARPLYGLDTLKELDVSGNRLSASQLNSLIKALPNCKVINN